MHPHQDLRWKAYGRMRDRLGVTIVAMAGKRETRKKAWTEGFSMSGPTKLELAGTRRAICALQGIMGQAGPSVAFGTRRRPNGQKICGDVTS